MQNKGFTTHLQKATLDVATAISHYRNWKLYMIEWAKNYQNHPKSGVILCFYAETMRNLSQISIMLAAKGRRWLEFRVLRCWFQGCWGRDSARCRRGDEQGGVGRFFFMATHLASWCVTSWWFHEVVIGFEFGKVLKAVLSVKQGPPCYWNLMEAKPTCTERDAWAMLTYAWKLYVWYYQMYCPHLIFYRFFIEPRASRNFENPNLPHLLGEQLPGEELRSEPFRSSPFRDAFDLVVGFLVIIWIFILMLSYYLAVIVGLWVKVIIEVMLWYRGIDPDQFYAQSFHCLCLAMKTIAGGLLVVGLCWILISFPTETISAIFALSAIFVLFNLCQWLWKQILWFSDLFVRGLQAALNFVLALLCLVPAPAWAAAASLVLVFVACEVIDAPTAQTCAVLAALVTLMFVVVIMCTFFKVWQVVILQLGFLFCSRTFVFILALFGGIAAAWQARVVFATPSASEVALAGSTIVVATEAQALSSLVVWGTLGAVWCASLLRERPPERPPELQQNTGCEKWILGSILALVLLAGCAQQSPPAAAAVKYEAPPAVSVVKHEAPPVVVALKTLEQKTIQETRLRLCQKYYFGGGSPTCPPGYSNQTIAELETEEMQREVFAIFMKWGNSGSWILNSYMSYLPGVVLLPAFGPFAPLTLGTALPTFLPAVIDSVRFMKFAFGFLNVVAAASQHVRKTPLEPAEAWARYCDQSLEPKHKFSLLLQGKLSSSEAFDMFLSTLSDLGYYMDTFDKLGGTQALAFKLFEEAAEKDRKISDLQLEAKELLSNKNQTERELSMLGEDLQAAVRCGEVLKAAQQGVSDAKKAVFGLKYLKIIVHKSWGLMLKEACEDIKGWAVDWMVQDVEVPLKVVLDMGLARAGGTLLSIGGLISAGFEAVEKHLVPIAIQFYDTRVEKLAAQMREKKAALQNYIAQLIDNAQQSNVAKEAKAFLEKTGTLVQGVSIGKDILSVFKYSFSSWWSPVPEADKFQCVAWPRFSDGRFQGIQNSVPDCEHSGKMQLFADKMYRPKAKCRCTTKLLQRNHLTHGFLKASRFETLRICLSPHARMPFNWGPLRACSAGQNHFQSTTAKSSRSAIHAARHHPLQSFGRILVGGCRLGQRGSTRRLQFIAVHDRFLGSQSPGELASLFLFNVFNLVRLLVRLLLFGDDCHVVNVVHHVLGGFNAWFKHVQTSHFLTQLWRVFSFQTQGLQDFPNLGVQNVLQISLKVLQALKAFTSVWPSVWYCVFELQECPGMIYPAQNEKLVQKLKEKNITCFAMESGQRSQSVSEICFRFSLKDKHFVIQFCNKSKTDLT